MGQDDINEVGTKLMSANSAQLLEFALVIVAAEPRQEKMMAWGLWKLQVADLQCAGNHNKWLSSIIYLYLILNII